MSTKCKLDSRMKIKMCFLFSLKVQFFLTTVFISMAVVFLFILINISVLRLHKFNSLVEEWFGKGGREGVKLCSM